jgi:hypothetical protein
MEIVFGLLILALILLGLRSRKKEKKEWVKEERFEESGAWIDKRSGERGTYGSLDDEMEANRHYIARKSRIAELSQAVQSFYFAQYPNFHTFSDEQIKGHLVLLKTEISGLFEQIENLSKDGTIQTGSSDFPANELRFALKKVLLHFSLERFPLLLDLEITKIKQYDQATEHAAQRLLEHLARFQRA